MQSETFEFVTAGGRHVRARLERPAGQVRAYALFAHCFTCGKDNLAATRIARALADVGIGALRFDFAGIGEAGMAHAPEGFSTDVADLITAGRTMAERGCAPQILIGHSLGGAAVIAAAGDLPSVRAVATIGAPFDVSHVLKLIGPGADGLMHGETHEAMIAGRPVRVGAGFADDLRMQDQSRRLHDLNRALLILHSPRDDIVGIEESTKIYVAARHPKSFISLDPADHLLSRARDAAYAANVIAAWAERYIEAENADAQPSSPPAPDGVVRVAETGAGRFQVRVEAGGASLMADEPVAVGGLGSGPSPYDLVAAGLGACTAMTLRLYAERKGWPLVHTSVELKHQKTAGAARPDRFERVITLDGPLDADQRARLLEIADKCPVHRTLEAGAEVVTRAHSTLPEAPPEDHFAAMDAACREES